MQTIDKTDHAEDSAGGGLAVAKANVAEYMRALLFTPVYFVRGLILRVSAVRSYYFSRGFYRVIFQYFLRYLFINPYTVCKLYFRQCGLDSSLQTIYGETPLTTFAKIARAAEITEKDVVYELGCGRGLGVFWLRFFCGCRCVGLDVNPIFINKAVRVAASTHTDGVEFYIANFVRHDFSEASVIYLYGSALSESAVSDLTDRFASLRKGTRIVTVSYALSDFRSKDESERFELEKVIVGNFVWGDTNIYIQRVV